MSNLKIIVDGPFSSGKTTFVRSATERKAYLNFINVAINLQADYIAMDYGTIQADSDSELVILGTPSGRPFSFDWLFLKNSIVGYVFMMDSAQPATFHEAKHRIAYFKKNSPKPFIVAANKQDKEGAWLLDDLRLALDIPSEIPVVPCVATDKESVKRVLLTLLDEVLKALVAESSPPIM